MILYRAADPATVRIVPMDAVTLIHHRSSGLSHIVDAPVPEILAALTPAPLDVPALLALLAERYELADPDPAALAVRLDELVRSGLVERLCDT
jgi:PqqD family protein of HPr-rel-A system